MRIPISWLAEHVDLPADSTPEALHAALVRVGFEEETVHGGDLSGPVVVGQVLEFTEEPQKNGKTIRWCRVRVAPDGERAADGGDPVRGIVCGAHNFSVDDHFFPRAITSVRLRSESIMMRSASLPTLIPPFWVRS